MDPIRTETIQALVGYWGRTRGDRAMPARAEVDVLDMPREVLPHLLLLEPLWDRDPLIFRFRVIGTGVTQLTGRDLTGGEMTPDIYGEHGETILEPVRRAAREARPYLFHNRFAWRAHGFLSESVYLPLGGEDGVGMLLCGLVGISHQEASKDEYLKLSDTHWRPLEEAEIAAAAVPVPGSGA